MTYERVRQGVLRQLPLVWTSAFSQEPEKQAHVADENRDLHGPPMTTLRTLSIIIPAYNEERTIHLILDKVRDVVLDHGIAKEVIIVNDGSKDGTVQAIERYMAANPAMGIRFIQQPHNMGGVLPFIGGSRRPKASTYWCRTPTWSMTPASTTCC